MKKTKPFGIPGLPFFFLLCFSGSYAQDANYYINKGDAFVRKYKYDSAIFSYTQAIKLNPANALVYKKRGNAYLSEQRHNKEAIEDLTVAITAYPNDKSLYLSRARAYYSSDPWERKLKLQDYDKAISIDPHYLDALKGKADLLMLYDHQTELSVQEWTKVISIEPSNYKNYEDRAYAYTLLKQTNLAIQDYTQAIKLNADVPFLYFARAHLYTTIGEYEKSVSDLAHEFNTSGSVREELVRAVYSLSRLHRFQEASKYYYNGLFKDGKYVYFLNLNISTSDYARKTLEAIVKYFSKNDFSNGYKTLIEAEGLYRDKVKELSAFYKDDFFFTTLLSLKGYALEQMGKLDEARQVYDQSLMLNAYQPDVIAGMERLGRKKSIIIQTDNTLPVITILEPVTKRSISIEDDQNMKTQRIRGKVTDESGIKKVTVNNKELKIEDPGYFETTVTIKQGTNIFTVVAIDNNGNVATENVVVETSTSQPAPKPPSKDIPVLNSTPIYHAILIGETSYQDSRIKNLPGTIADMRKICDLLQKNYTFTASNTDTLENAGRNTILSKLILKANAMSENDNLFIFYAGHGQMVKNPDGTEEGFLVPTDAIKNQAGSYISSDDLVRAIKYSKAKHILFVADACFAGSLFRDISTDAPAPVAEAYKDKSRKLLASGNRQAVPDQSDFIEYLRLALQENNQKYITAEQLIDGFKNQYKSTTHLQLQYYPIRNVDDLGGQFVFTRK